MITLKSIFAALLVSVLSLFGIHSQAGLPSSDQSVEASASTSVSADMSIDSSSASSPSASVAQSAAIAAAHGTSVTPVAAATTAAVTAALSSDDLPAGSSWLTTLPLGDNRYTTSGPKKGYIYVCHVQSGGGGAQVDGPWIHGSTWNPSEKVRVQGSVNWPEATYSMKISNSTRLISSNDLPTDHTTGIFPIQASDPAAAYDRNPGSITARSYSFSLPAYPAALAQPGCIYGEVGIMNNGVLLFDGFDALYRDALAHELQDSHDGHPNDEGYHEHGFISDIKNVLVSTVVGFAFDGYPITGPLLPSGKYLTTDDLDECHGMTSSVLLDGKVQKSYHYVLTQDFPYSASCFHGKNLVTPDKLRAQGLETNTAESVQTSAEASALMNSQNGVQANAQVGTQAGAGTGQNPPAPPQEAITACSGKSQGASCSVGQGQVSGSCGSIGSYFACVPSGR